MGADKKKPLVEAVPRGKIVVGSDVQKQMGVKPGDSVQFRGRSFTVKQVHTPRGSDEDITVWLNLADAQELLGKKGKINVVLALECNCETDRLDRVREEIRKVLPDTQVMEMSVIAEGRARARNEAKAAAKAAIDNIKRDREALRAGRASLAGLLLPVVFLASTVWLGGLTFANVHERRGEIGILRAVGVSGPRVAALVLARALLIGTGGALVGYPLGVACAVALSEDSAGVDSAVRGFHPALTLLLLAGAPLWCALASVMPALVAARQDAAAILTEA